MDEVTKTIESLRLQVHQYQKNVAQKSVVRLRVKVANNAAVALEKRVLAKAEALLGKRVIDFEEVFETLAMVC